MLLSSSNDVGLMPRGRHRVEGETGLYLYVSPDEQVRRWIFRFTSPVSKRVTETGGGMADRISLAQAKAKAHELRKQIAAGICPIAAKRTAKTEQTTFEEAADEWIAIHKPYCVHGFRSSFRDYMGNETSFAREPVEHCLAHRLGNSVELAYRRQDNLNKRRVIMEAWADFCNGDASRAQREAA